MTAASVADTSKGNETRKLEAEAKIRYWMEAAYEEAQYENSQCEEIQEMTKYIDYLLGKQWPAKRPSYRAKPVNNRVWRLFWELVSLLTDIRPMFEIKALRKDYNHHAEIINKCTRSWWMESDADLKLAMIIVYSLLGTGFSKLEWNSGLRNGEGDFNLIPAGPNEVLPLKARHSLESSQAVIYRMPMPLSFFRGKYPTKGHLVKPDIQFSKFIVPAKAPGNMPQFLFDRLSPGMQRIVGTGAKDLQSSYPMALYREFWLTDPTTNPSNVPVTMGRPGANWSYVVHPGQPLYPRGRLVVMGGDIVLSDGPNPYWHGSYPFGSCRMNVVPWQFHGLSEMKPLIDLQDIVNQILAGVIDMIRKTVNPPFIAPKNAFSEQVWQSLDWSMPGARAQYNIASAHQPQWGQPPSLPAFVMNTLMLVAREMDATSGLASIAEAVRKKQVPAADTLEQIKQTQQTPIRLKGRNIEVFLRRMGTQNISNIFQFYTAERRMFMLGKDGLTPEDFDYDPKTMIPNGVRPEDHVRNFVFMVYPGTMLSINQVERNIMLMNLRKMGDLDRNTLLKQLDIGLDPDKIEQGLLDEKKKEFMLQLLAQAATNEVAGAAAAAAPAGAPAGPPQV